jgi:flagellar biosynthesis protein FlhF
MKVKKFVAGDMRAALREVREELGANAVILSNRTVNDQVEILATIDYEEEQVDHAFSGSQNTTAPVQAFDENQDQPISAAAYYEQAAAERFKQDQLNIIKQASSVDENNLGSEPPTKNNLRDDNQAASLFQKMSQDNSGMNEMKSELKSLRAVIENQQVLSEWGAIAQQHPLRIPLYKRFTEMGLSQDVCKYLVKGLDDLTDIEQAMQAALKQLVHQLPIADDDIINQGGVIAMVGPTGVGKTTTIAKLAARFAMRHGQRHVALISTDNYRIGAHEQLMTYGRLLGVPVHTANNQQELDQLLRKLYDKKLVLIDTAGMSQRDVRLSEQFAHLGNNSSIIKSYLVLSANAQLATLDEAIKSFKKANLAGCILTKLDEAVSLGGLLSAMIKHHLPAAYVSHGQRVPEDLQPARARDLIADTLSRMKYHKEPSDEDFMAVAFSSDASQARI